MSLDDTLGRMIRSQLDLRQAVEHARAIEVPRSVPIWTRLVKSLDQSIANNALVAVTFDTERADTDTLHDTVTNNTRITIQHAGVYTLVAVGVFALNATGERQIRLRVNGATDLDLAGVPGNATTFLGMTAAATFDFSVNDYVEMIAYQNSGGALNLSATWTFFSAVRH